MTMELQLIKKGALYTADCTKCGANLYTHEWADIDHNERRDAMEVGTLRCDQCAIGCADPETFSLLGRSYYAGRYSMPGYLDCTDWLYGKNKRKLIKELRDMYEG